MSSIVYLVTGSAQEQEYGILGTDQATQHSAVTMPFLRDKSIVERIVRQLNDSQMPIPEFCEYYMSGELERTCESHDHDS